MLSRPQAERKAAEFIENNPHLQAVPYLPLRMALTDLLLQIAGGEPVAWRVVCADGVSRDHCQCPYRDDVRANGLRAVLDAWSPEMKCGPHRIQALGVIGETHGG